ncbi:succinyl-CoA--3-ketoacid-CoA transferase [Bacteroidia bacterium]|nr:succinyl-CoA--3-ketoacid-CoA transferase [Bacteroidia bacterium]
MHPRERICRRAARELSDGQYVNLGIGMPSAIPNYIPDGVHIMLQGENGILGIGPDAETEDHDFTDASGKCIQVSPGASYFDSTISFTMLRGGHLDVTILGALQVDAQGSLANWMVPGVRMPGMGGAMDLVVGTKRVIITMDHTDKNGNPKLLAKCTYPLTAVGQVNTVITEKGVFDISRQGVVVREIAQGLTAEELQACTGAALIFPKHIETMRV